MNYAPVEEAIAAMGRGDMVLVVDDEDRENEGDLTMAAESVTPEAINFMAKYGRGLICLTLTEEQLDTRCRSVLDSAEVSATVITDRSLPGAGTVPGMGIRSPVILVAGDVESMWRSLLDGPIPIVGRRDERGLIVDLRAVLPSDDAAVASALSAACR